MIDLQKGDCIELMKKIPSGSIDAIICDPPYGTTNCKWDLIIPFDLMWEQLNRIIKTNGAIVLFGSEPFSSLLRLSNIKDYKYDWIWEKTTVTGHLNAKKQPLRCYENISVFYSKQPTYNPIKTFGHERKVISASSRDKSIERGLSKNSVYGTEVIGKVENYDSTERYPRNILRFPTDKQKLHLHPTQKPVSLMKYFIETYTNEGDLVLDFTMGSGSTIVACIETNRNAIGIENDDHNFSVAENRINATKAQLKMF